jgi:RNA polymerase sigma-54 factor
MNFGFGLRLEQKLSQELHLHPQLILTLKLLPLTSLELEGVLRQEIEENPVLEEVPDVPESGPESDVMPDSAESRKEEGGDGLISETEEGPDVASREMAEFLDVLSNDSYYMASRQAASAPDSETDLMELTPDLGPSISDALMPQLRGKLDEEGARIAEIVLGSLDEDGLLAVPPEELILNHDLDKGRLRAVLYVIQRIEPGGIACRDQREALMVQLEMHGYETGCLEYRIVAEFWQLLLQVKLGKIAKLCAVSEKQVRHAAECVHGLETRPGRRYARRRIDYVSPDFTVFWRDGKLTFDYNDDRVPHLRLAHRFVLILKSPKSYPKEQVDFARLKYNRAVMFLRAIESRRRTLRKLMRLIINQQGDFFEHGPEHLKPATMREAAGHLEVHPSTVSRASAGKYVETTYGIYPLKFFFTAGAGNKSRTSIKGFVRGIIDKENRDKPLSDDAIGRKLREEHCVEISRRTVAKYRGELGIPGRNHRGKL